LANVAAQLKEHLGATSLQLSNVKDELLQKHRQVVALGKTTVGRRSFEIVKWFSNFSARWPLIKVYNFP